MLKKSGFEGNSLARGKKEKKIQFGWGNQEGKKP